MLILTSIIAIPLLLTQIFTIESGNLALNIYQGLTTLELYPFPLQQIKQKLTRHRVVELFELSSVRVIECSSYRVIDCSSYFAEFQLEKELKKTDN